MDRLTGKVALVTGGASGLGAAIVRKFREEGALVVFSDIQAGLAASLAEETGAHFVQQDVTDEAGWVQTIAAVEALHGRLDVMVNNAGVIGGTNIVDIDIAAWNRLIGINLTGVMLGCQHAIALMRRNPGGSSGAIINMSSNVGKLGIAADVAYCASKGGVTLLTKSVAMHCARAGFNIRCNSIHPGAIQTPIHDSFMADDPAAKLSFLRDQSPLKRMGQPDEIAMMAVFLGSDEAPFATGAEFMIDGGTTAGVLGS